MNATRMYIRMNYIEGALMRLIGAAGRRGFEITGVDAKRSACGSRYDITLDLYSNRNADILSRQIGRLYDVQSIEIQAEPGRIPVGITGAGAMKIASAS